MKIVSVFAIVFAIFYFGIQILRKLTGKEQWQIAKLLAYSLVCATLTVFVLAGIVILF